MTRYADSPSFFRLSHSKHSLIPAAFSALVGPDSHLPISGTLPCVPGETPPFASSLRLAAAEGAGPDGGDGGSDGGGRGGGPVTLAGLLGLSTISGPLRYNA